MILKHEWKDMWCSHSVEKRSIHEGVQIEHWRHSFATSPTNTRVDSKYTHLAASQGSILKLKEGFNCISELPELT